MEHDPALFESAWLKWAWAKYHAQALNAEVAAWRNKMKGQEEIVCGGYYNAKRHRIDVSVLEIESLPLEWGLFIGDIAHNYRSCLDHIAWALVERGRTPPATLTPTVRGKIYFPIYRDRVKFNDSLDTLLPGVGRADRAVVRRYQPYTEGVRRRDNHAFWILRSLSNDDKHPDCSTSPDRPAGRQLQPH